LFRLSICTTGTIFSTKYSINFSEIFYTNIHEIIKMFYGIPQALFFS